MISYAVAIGVGGAAGSLLRWVAGLLLNPLWSAIPLGTVFANVSGCFCIGLGSAFFSAHAALQPEWRLGIITGVLGGYTTFSTFTFELLTMLQEGRLVTGLGALALHLGCGLLLAALGLALGTRLWAQ
ncbi:putative fluoride ion transporter CrcB [compost metagenome]